MRRQTWPHSGKRSTAVQEGYPIMKMLPKRIDPCPCGKPSVDIEYMDLDENGKPTIKTSAIPAPYRDCCEGKNKYADTE